MSDKDIHPNKFSELRSIYKYYIDSYNALYQLKTENEEDLNSIYKLIKTELIDSNKHPPQIIIRDILNIIPYNNRYTKSYLSLAKLISDDYHVTDVRNAGPMSDFLFYKEHGIELDKFDDFEKICLKNLDIHKTDTIYRAIMYNDLERFIAFTERDGFDEDQTLESRLYPYEEEYFNKFSLLELCCYHGAVDCFKFLQREFESKITRTCFKFSFLGANPEIMSECLKYQKPNYKCMKYAIISHNIDFITFLMNEYNLGIVLDYCAKYNNIESLLVYFDQTNNVYTCFYISVVFNIPSLCEYFLSNGININEKDEFGQTTLHIAAQYNNKETVELLISHGININEKDKNGQTALHRAVYYNRKETAELLISYGININEKDNREETALHIAVSNNRKEITELLISHGININEKAKYGETALHIAVYWYSKEITELLISHGANINEKNNNG
ncbi:hypothetical protein TVAG_377790 [Trichomonas vaginalis G3]|uniref:DUF3447 domain-containing protein n=1 Tax=Trichomonas vaginalis (strain ATCC PRA-98 / G3) TaxID=412133 RepID=A2DAX0_TRIV3|nr:proteasome regulatory particle assembly [Trichomonas vaginalis G3]EAY22300.1 hypothetical protein TVAG_377790 [Trichomonas vaginalis G3]KAI5518238.1 proteasome regulatory particle assembly [Trichomonas vaginalis G3]|eukprot:XP_001583286.1 hypothetical protein [Trichomonas vaginalis G3]